MEELQQDDDALLAAAIELSLVPQPPPPQQPQPSLPQPLDAFSSGISHCFPLALVFSHSLIVLSEASNRDASVGLNSLLVSLQQALGQPAPADEGAKMVNPALLPKGCAVRLTHLNGNVDLGAMCATGPWYEHRQDCCPVRSCHAGFVQDDGGGPPTVLSTMI